MTDGETYLTPEDAAADGDAGETLGVAVAPDGRWAVVVRRRAGSLMFVLCEAVHGGWRFHDEDEMVTSGGTFQRGVWTSLVDDNVGPNLGVEVTFGPAPAGATQARLRDGDEWFFARVRDEAFWLVRWDVPDADDVGGLELVDFTPE
ncbi:MAG: hypothetical protein QOD44_1377 [Solirubrobacteraceae bacterium]|jgi:hypothetical protein|nr:hypothetical protein [Solirubrobacteraceae bacterium]